jgi:hypothetical protein
MDGAGALCDRHRCVRRSRCQALAALTPVTVALLTRPRLAVRGSILGRPLTQCLPDSMRARETCSKRLI